MEIILRGWEKYEGYEHLLTFFIMTKSFFYIYIYIYTSFFIFELESYRMMQKKKIDKSLTMAF